MRVVGSEIHGTYATARSIAGLFAFAGWAFVMGGVFTVLAGLSAGAPFSAMIAGIGIVIVAIGLLQVAAAQVLRASVDTADYGRQSLLLQIAVAEGQSEIDLGQSADRESTNSGPDVGGNKFHPEMASADPTLKTFSEEAIAALRKCSTKGYVVNMSSDGRSVTLVSGSWRVTFTTNDEIIKFAQAIR